MKNLKKYRLSNQPKEYELVTEYLGWTPVGYGAWGWFLLTNDILSDYPLPLMLEFENMSGTKRVSLILHQWLSVDALPLELFDEERSMNWHRFAIVSLEEEPWALFIIPLH